MMIHVVVPRIEDFPMIFITEASIDQDCKMWFWDHWSAREKIHYDMGTRYADTIYNDVSGFAGYSMNHEGARALRHKYMQELRQEAINTRDEAQAEIDRIEGIIAELSAIDAPPCKKFGVDFHSAGGALTLRPSDIGEHPSGWVVSGEIKEDYYLWVNKFEATHPTLGRVWGDFEDQVFYTSIEAYDDFRKYFNPEDWDYQDI